MKRLAELLLLVVICSLIYSRLSVPKSKPSPTPAATPSTAAAGVSSADPIPPPPGVELCDCPHSYDNAQAQKLFDRHLEEEGPQARLTLNKAIQLEPANAAGHFHLSTLLDRPGSRGVAIEEATRALECQPGFAQAWNQRAWLRAQSTDPPDWELGLIDVRHALGLSQDTDFFDTRGVLLLRLGRPQEALYDVERAVREGSSRIHLEHRAQVYQALGRHQEAEQDRQQALKSPKT